MVEVVAGKDNNKEAIAVAVGFARKLDPEDSNNWKSQFNWALNLADGMLDNGGKRNKYTQPIPPGHSIQCFIDLENGLLSYSTNNG